MWCIEVVCSLVHDDKFGACDKKSHLASHSIAVWRGHCGVEWVQVFDVSVYVLVDEVTWQSTATTHSVMLHCTRIASRSDTVADSK